ncbi:MAG: hypothetical protein V4671_09130 [Armatimonadota bacterium]
MSRPKKAEAQELVVCPRCAGNKRVMDFRSGDRATGEPAGWKAVECPGCGGVGSVDTKAADAIVPTMEQDSPA